MWSVPIEAGDRMIRVPLSWLLLSIALCGVAGIAAAFGLLPLLYIQIHLTDQINPSTVIAAHGATQEDLLSYSWGYIVLATSILGPLLAVLRGRVWRVLLIYAVAPGALFATLSALLVLVPGTRLTGLWLLHPLAYHAVFVVQAFIGASLLSIFRRAPKRRGASRRGMDC